MKKLKGSGDYALLREMSPDSVVQGDYREDTHRVYYTFEYDVCETFAEMLEILGETKVFDLALKHFVVNVGNNTREAIKSKNGHGSVKILTQEEKANNKVKRAEDKALMDKVKASIANGTLDISSLG